MDSIEDTEAKVFLESRWSPAFMEAGNVKIAEALEGLPKQTITISTLSCNVALLTPDAAALVKPSRTVSLNLGAF